jgi:hypothetical protein
MLNLEFAITIPLIITSLWLFTWNWDLITQFDLDFIMKYCMFISITYSLQYCMIWMFDATWVPSHYDDW